MPTDRPVPMLTVADVAVGGDIHRIILDGIRVPSGVSALDVRRWIVDEYDALRAMMLGYPYGDPDMCADLVFPSALADVSHGFMVMECMGHPYYSGSNTMATAAAIADYGMAAPADDGTLILEAPSGPVTAHLEMADGHTNRVAVDGDPAYLIADGLSADLAGLGRVPYALVWSGNVFIMVDAGEIGIPINESGLDRMKEIGLTLTSEVAKAFAHAHPLIGPVEAPMFVHFYETPMQHADGFVGRGATYGHPTTVFKCPTGTGTAAQMALFFAQGAMPDDTSFEITSAYGHVFTGEARGSIDARGIRMLKTRIAARPFVLSEVHMHLDFENPVMAPFQKLSEIAG